jgi:hypothetical protein
VEDSHHLPTGQVEYVKCLSYLLTSIWTDTGVTSNGIRGIIHRPRPAVAFESMNKLYLNNLVIYLLTQQLKKENNMGGCCGSNLARE